VGADLLNQWYLRRGLEIDQKVQAPFDLKETRNDRGGQSLHHLVLVARLDVEEFLLDFERSVEKLFGFSFREILRGIDEYAQDLIPRRRRALWS